MLLAGAALALAASPAPPVEVVSREVALTRHDVAPVEVRCNRARRPCRGVLVLGVARCTGPAIDPDCQVPVGRRRFAIRAGTTRKVFVHRGGALEHRADGPDVLVVGATPFLGRPTTTKTRRTRSVRLVAPAGLPRPRPPAELRRAERLEADRDAVRFHAALPRGTRTASGALAGRALDLHRRMFAPYVVAAESFAVTAELWHGELPVRREEFRAGERHPYRLTACDAATCTDLTGDIELARDEQLVPRPICVLRPL